ncbi:hypothetical protein [Luteimonas huabeiensis]|uniref:hypothetical protein n=1 Tax=Luteimonas huabeiensis TaxID=1244513 RepID=UPI0004669A8B|nr:hypothetical protein [Luteimonas huabeiensis]
MPTLSPQSESLLTAFAAQPGVAQHHVGNLRGILEGSPALADRFDAAVAQGHLKQLAPLAHANAGGEYDPASKTIRLPLGKLDTPPNAGDLTFVMGHELQHAFNAEAVRQASAAFSKQVEDVASSSGAVHDYTPATADMLAAHRRNEASAEIAGWNAIVSRLRVTNPTPTLADIHGAGRGRMMDFIDVGGTSQNPTHTLKPGLSLSSDMTMPATPENLEAMGRHYFDKPPRQPGGLGPQGSADYANYYAASLVSFVAQRERHHNPPQPGVEAPRMTFDMSRLRLSEKLLEVRWNCRRKCWRRCATWRSRPAAAAPASAWTTARRPGAAATGSTSWSTGGDRHSLCEAHVCWGMGYRTSSGASARLTWSRSAGCACAVGCRLSGW